MSGPRDTTSSVAGLIIAKSLRAPLWLLISAALARTLGPSGLGAWSMILAAATVLNNLLLQWTQSITQRYGRSEWLRSGGLGETWASRWPLLLGGFAIIAALLIARPLAWPLRFYGIDAGLEPFILPAVLALWLTAETQGLQQVRERFAAFAVSPIVADVVLLGVLGLLAVAARYGVGANNPRFSFVCLTATGVVTWMLWLARELRGIRLEAQMPDRGQWRRSIRFASPLIPGFLVGYLAEWCDYFLIRHYYSDFEVGLFHPAYQYMLIMVGLPAALATVLLPRVVGNADAGKPSVRRLIEHDAPRLTTLWVVLVLPIVTVLPQIFTWLLGTRYGPSTEVLQVLLIAVPGAIVQHVYNIAHFVQGRLFVSTLALFGLKIAVNIAISAYLLPKLGVVGSAIGAGVSYLILQWMFVLDQHRHLRLRHGAAAVALLVAQVAGIVLALVGDTLPRILVTAGACLLLLAWARRTALFSREDVSAMLPQWLNWMERPSQRLLCGKQ